MRGKIALCACSAHQENLEKVRGLPFMTLKACIQRLTRSRLFHGGLLIWFLILSILLFVFVKMASEVLEGDTMAFDRFAMAALRKSENPSLPLGPGWLQSAMLDVTAIGGVAVLTLITGIVAGFLAVSRKGKLALFVVTAVSTGALVSTLLKSLFDRPRPDLVSHLIDVNTTSFPSGHAMNSAVVYLTLAALLARTRMDNATRIYILSMAIALALTIGFSRVYLGVHWPSDVIAGWAVGAFWAALCSVGMQVLQRRRLLDPSQTEIKTGFNDQAKEQGMSPSTD